MHLYTERWNVGQKSTNNNTTLPDSWGIKCYRQHLVHTHTHSCFTALWILSRSGQPIHQLTLIVVINHPLSASSIYCKPWHPPCSITCLTVFLHNLCPSLLWSISSSGTPHNPHHTPYISSPNHCLLFAAHAHIIATQYDSKSHDHTEQHQQQLP